MSTLRRVLIGFGIFCLLVFAFGLAAPICIPTHGLTTFEEMLLLSIPGVAFCLAGPKGPQRYWLYFGMVCSAMMLLILLNYVLFDSHGRRHRLPLDDYWMAKAAALVLYVSLSPLLAAVLRSKLAPASRLPKTSITRRV